MTFQLPIQVGHDNVVFLTPCDGAAFYQKTIPMTALTEKTSTLTGFM